MSWLHRHGVLCLVALILGFGCTLTRPAPAPVTVYYFHSTVRCDDCLEIERYTDEVLRQNFAPELRSGRLRWEPVNSDLPENIHFVYDYDLAANELVVVDGGHGARGAWHKLPDAWQLLPDPELLRERIVALVAAALTSTEQAGKGIDHE